MHDRREGLKLTCGVVLTDGVRFLMGDAGGWRDLPKGRAAPGEDHAHAAARELTEETGIRIDPADLVPLGLFHYRHDTDLVLHLARVETMPDPSTLRCASMVADGLPEMLGYENVPWASLEERATPNMSRCLRLVEPFVMGAVRPLAHGALPPSKS